MKAVPDEPRKYIEATNAQAAKKPGGICGDYITTERTAEATTVIVADGIGTGIKARVAAVMCASRLMELIRVVCEQNLGTVKVHPQLRREASGSEDFSYMMKRVQDQGGQASMLRILTETAAVAHNSRYDFDDTDALPKAVKAISAVTFRLLTKGTP